MTPSGLPPDETPAPQPVPDAATQMRGVAGPCRASAAVSVPDPAAYDLRRLNRKGLIVRLSGHHRYQITPLGRRVAVLFTKTYGRVLAPGLAALDPRPPAELVRRSPLAIAWRQFDCALDDFISEAPLATGALSFTKSRFSGGFDAALSPPTTHPDPRKPFADNALQSTVGPAD